MIAQVPWQTMVNCDGSYTLEEGITPHKSPRVLQTLMWISTIAAGTPHQLIFAGEQPMPMGALPWGGAGSHPERSFWGETAPRMQWLSLEGLIDLTEKCGCVTGAKGGMPLYAAVETYAAQMRVILPSVSAPFGVAQPNVTVLNHTILVPPTGVSGWAAGESLTAGAWRQAPGLVSGPGGNSTYCGAQQTIISSPIWLIKQVSTNIDKAVTEICNGM